MSATRTTAEHDDRAPQPAPASRRVSVVIPACNEAANLPHVFARLPDDLFEVVVVDGGSLDGTVEVAQALRPDVTIVRQDGRGRGHALARGVAAVRGDIVVTLEGDGSTDPQEIPRFVDALVDGADVVAGNRLAAGGSSDTTPLRVWGNRLLSRTANAMFGIRCSDLCHGYNALWTRRWTTLDLRGAPGVRERVLWARRPAVDATIKVRSAASGLHVVEVPTRESPRLWGVSTLNPWRDGARVLAALVVERLHRTDRSEAAAAAPGPTGPPAEHAVPDDEVSSHGS